MKPRTIEPSRRSRNLHGEGPNWILIAGGALLSTLSVRLVCKLKQAIDSKQPEIRCQNLKGNRKPSGWKKPESCIYHPDAFGYPQDENGCCRNYRRSRSAVEIKQHCDVQMLSDPEMSLPLVTVPTSEFHKENGVIWSSSPDRLELLQKPFHHSNSSESPCVSESGSDIFSKRGVIQKLRHQLKRRDGTVLEMQDQIEELQNSYTAQISHSSHLQFLLDTANRDLFDSEREIQRLRKAIADHRVGQTSAGEKSPAYPIWLTEDRNGYTNGYLEIEKNFESSHRMREEGGKIELLKREISELKELIGGKDYLLQSYKEQKFELSEKIKELQQRLDSQLPSIL